MVFAMEHFSGILKHPDVGTLVFPVVGVVEFANGTRKGRVRITSGVPRPLGQYRLHIDGSDEEYTLRFVGAADLTGLFMNFVGMGDPPILTE